MPIIMQDKDKSVIFNDSKPKSSVFFYFNEYVARYKYFQFSDYKQNLNNNFKQFRNLINQEQ